MDDVGPSMLTNMFRRSPPEGLPSSTSTVGHRHDDRPRTPRSISAVSVRIDPAEPSPEENEGISEATPLIGHKPHRPQSPDDVDDIESQKHRSRATHPCFSIKERAGKRIRDLGAIMNPRTWDKRAAWERAVVGPMRCLPAVVVGLLLNILDALSYGKSLAPVLFC